MRKFTILLGVLFVFGIALQTRAQKGNSQSSSPDGQSEGIDYRIDNMEYWMKLAEKGKVPYNPFVYIPPAIYKGSVIQTKSLITDSPDVPVTSITSTTQSENSVFVDPDNNSFIINSNNSTDWSGTTVGSVFGADYFKSNDAGTTYTGTINGAGAANSGDPATAIGRNGRQYVNFIDDPGGQGIAFSDDGNTWTTATIAPNPGDLADKNHMCIDNSLSSPYTGNLYTAWTDFGGSYDYNVVFSRSTNNGATWSTRVPISGTIATFDHGVNVQTGPGGQVYACWATYPSSGLTEDGIGFNKSLDGGVTFGTPTKIISNIKGIRATGVLKSMRVNSFPVMAVDVSGGPNNGNLYVVWTNIGVPGTNTGTNKSVYIIRSTDGGTTWSAPVKVNQGAFADGKEAYEPWITCDPETGTLAVIFYDDRNTASNSCEAWVAYSLDAGNTWTDFRVSDVSFTPVPIPGLASSYMGDYLGITSKGGRVYPCWTDNRGGVYRTYVSPFFIGLNASFTANNTSICTGGSVTFTNQSSGPPLSWQWTFPGGTPGSYTGADPPAITYNTPGTYDVTLVVTDASGNDTETKTGFITVANVFADFTASITSVVVGNTVTFTDNSQCTPTAWNWTFAGGTPSTYIGQNPPPITYSTLGTYDVSLTVTKSSSSDIETKTGYISVIPPEFTMANGSVTTCTGNFYDPGGATGNYTNNLNITETFYPSTAGAAIRFTFNSFATEAGYDYLRIYNGTSTSAPLLATYNGSTGPGTVTASNASGALTFNFTSDGSVVASGWSASISCYVNTEPPVAAFTASTVIPPVNSAVTFTDQSTNLPTSWNWSITPPNFVFTAGTDANSQNPQVLFTAVGLYTVSLTAANVNGSDVEVKTGYISVVNCSLCASTSNNATEEWISNVTFNTINNTSAGSVGYQNFTGISTQVTPGSAYNLAVSCGMSGGTWTEHCWAFFDWNQDCDFSDAGESVDVGQINGAGTMNTSVTVPADAMPGNTRMRVSLKYNADPTSCETFSYGQVEDYSVVIQSTDKSLSLIILLEGLFNGEGMNKAQNALGDQFTGDIADQVVLELHNSTAPYNLEGGPYIANVNTNGTAVVSIPASLGSSYFIVIKHRNSIETWNSSPVSFSGASISYNFSSDAAQAYGNNLKLISGKYVLYGGDVNQDGIVDAGDMVAVDNDAKNFISGYVATDTNGDGTINITDGTLIQNNGAIFVAKLIPQ